MSKLHYTIKENHPTGLRNLGKIRNNGFSILIWDPKLGTANGKEAVKTILNSENTVAMIKIDYDVDDIVNTNNTPILGAPSRISINSRVTNTDNYYMFSLWRRILSARRMNQSYEFTSINATGVRTTSLAAVHSADAETGEPVGV